MASSRTARKPSKPVPVTRRRVCLTLPEPPSANRWWRKFRNRMVLSPEARDYKATVAALCRLAHRLGPLTGPVGVTLHWYRGRKSGDLDKRIGIALDALQGSAYLNDSQIVEITARRSDRPGQPGLDVTVVNL